jgi:thiol-disulfide isomerase/thioredoxin
MEKPTEVMMDKPTEAMMDKPTEETMPETTSTPEAMMDDKKMDAPAWFGLTLTNVSTDENFTINDFKGKVVLVETLAMWCPSCKKQQMEVKALQEMMMDGMGKDLVLIGLDIDPNENAADLKAYINNNGFDWLYAIAPADVSREIGSLYGDQFLNPPSTPILVIDRKGQAHPLPFGIKSADDLKKFIEPYLNEGM